VSKALITGITGFAGSHLADYLLAEQPDVAVYGTHRWRRLIGAAIRVDFDMKRGMVDGDSTKPEVAVKQ